MTYQELMPEETIEKKTFLTSKEVTVICEDIKGAKSQDECKGIIAKYKSDQFNQAGAERLIKATVSLAERLKAEEAKEADRLVKVDASVDWHMTNPFSKWNGTEEECRQAMLRNIK